MRSDIVTCALLAALPVLLMFLQRLRAPLGADEGYLWFGVQQLLRGRMPHRDFKSYEPGRYLWCAPFLLGDAGLFALRAATHLAFATGAFVALLTLRGLGLGWLELAMTGALLALWAHPQHKLFEPACLLLAWSAQAALWTQPSDAGFALAFVSLGLLLVFGFNLFLYAGAALALEIVLALLSSRIGLDRIPFGLSIGAALLGASPFLACLFSPAFARQFWRRRVASVFARGSANLPLPLPWPWRPVPAQMLESGRPRAFALVFLLVLALPWIGLALALAMPGALRPYDGAILSASSLGVFVAHHAASRADPAHLAQSIAPMLLLCSLLLAASGMPGAAPVTVALSLWLQWPSLRQLRACFRSGETDLVGGLRIGQPAAVSALVEEAASICAGQPPGRACLYAAPVLPALYAIAGRDSPVYDTFSVHPSDEGLQSELIAQLEAADVEGAIVSDATLDGREELRFSRTHPRVWDWLHQHLRASPLPQAGADAWSFRRRDGAPAPDQS